MATYEELFELRTDDGIKNRVAVAASIKAQALLALATPTANQVKWASDALKSPSSVQCMLMNYVLASNKDAQVSAIQGASDSAVQTAVDTAVDAIISGMT